MTIAYPLVNGCRHDFTSIELKLAGQIFTGFKSINYSRKRSRSMVMGNHPDPIAKTRGTNEYSADCELYLAEWLLFKRSLLGLGQGGYGDVLFAISVTYAIPNTNFETITDELLGCSMDTTDASNGQSSDALVRKVELSPIKIIFAGDDDVTIPLAPPPGS